jgi:hypothetical protein
VGCRRFKNSSETRDCSFVVRRRVGLGCLGQVSALKDPSAGVGIRFMELDQLLQQFSKEQLRLILVEAARRHPDVIGIVHEECAYLVLWE